MYYPIDFILMTVSLPHEFLPIQSSLQKSKPTVFFQLMMISSCWPLMKLNLDIRLGENFQIVSVRIFFWLMVPNKLCFQLVILLVFIYSTKSRITSNIIRNGLMRLQSFWPADLFITNISHTLTLIWHQVTYHYNCTRPLKFIQHTFVTGSTAIWIVKIF